MTLIGYWPLDENSGSKAYDYSGRENHGTLNGGVTQRNAGPLNENSYSFNGSDGYVSSAEGFSISGSDSLISAWAKASSSTGWQMVAGFHKGQNTGDHFALAITGKDEWGVHGFSDGDFSSGIAVDGDWHHLTAVYDGSQLRFYIDGVEAPKSPFNFSYNIQSTNMFLGVEEERLEYWYSGKLSEVRLYDRPLTASEVDYLYSVGKRGLQTTSRKSS